MMVSDPDSAFSLWECDRTTSEKAEPPWLTLRRRRELYRGWLTLRTRATRARGPRDGRSSIASALMKVLGASELTLPESPLLLKVFRKKCENLLLPLPYLDCPYISASIPTSRYVCFAVFA